MSTQLADFTDLLQDAVKQSKANAPRAVDNFYRCFAKVSEAVTSVTNGRALLELVLVKQSDTPNVYQLQLRKVGSASPPSDLGVYHVSKGGYPVLRWYSYINWEINKERPGDSDQEFSTLEELDAHFRWLVSDPKSRLVILVTFFQQ